MTTPKAIREFLASAGRKGGSARAKRLTAKQRSASASKAARARWEGEKGQTSGKGAQKARSSG